jgi:hypothetical protein
MTKTKWDRGFKYHSSQSLEALKLVKERLDNVIDYVDDGMDPHIVYDQAVIFEDAVVLFMEAMSKFEYFHLHNIHLYIENRPSNRPDTKE